MSHKTHDVVIYALKVLFNSTVLAGAIIAALAIRFDLQPDTIPSQYIEILAEQILYYLLFNSLLFIKFSLYENLIETVSINDLIRIVFSTGISCVALYIVGVVVGRTLPRTVYILTWLLSVVFVAGYMVLMRIVISAYKSYQRDGVKNLDRVMLIGVNDNTVLVINYLNSGANMGKAVVIIDHNGDKLGKRIKNVKVDGKISEIPRIAQKYNVNSIILCYDESQFSLRSETLKICLKTGCKLKSFTAPRESWQPGTHIGRQRFKNVEYSDLLKRSEVTLDISTCGYLRNAVILITGGGGSIGSELCRQICHYKPKRIVIFDIYENNAYDLQLELRAEYGDYIDISVRIGSICDVARVEEIFFEFRPSVVFHAAAHKHVPLMEESPYEAIKNNVYGTYNTALAAIKYDVSKFVLLSTDKAVNATSIMGASKRICELIIQSLNGAKTSFTTVRFGNVLGSSGSVVPLFQRQIEAGGPVTVVHPDITRYFMTIPEAAQLVVQAAGLARGGETFILQMGEPVKILDLARDLIRLSGYLPDVDIKINFVGLRPGEKMHEELSFDSENMSSTSNKKIFIAEPTDVDGAMLEEKLVHLHEALSNGGSEYNLREALNLILFDGREDTPIFPISMQKAAFEPHLIDLMKDLG